MLHPIFSEDLTDSTDPNAPGNVAETLEAGKESDGGASQFCRSDDKRGTYKIKRAKLARPQFGQIDASELQKSQTDDEKISVLVNADQIEESDLGEVTWRDLRFRFFLDKRLSLSSLLWRPTQLYLKASTLCVYLCWWTLCNDIHKGPNSSSVILICCRFRRRWGQRFVWTEGDDLAQETVERDRDRSEAVDSEDEGTLYKHPVSV